MNRLFRVALLCSILVCDANLVLAQRCNDCKTMLGKRHPSGNLVQHTPYSSVNIYYYDRPYNVGQAEQRALESATLSGIASRQPYSNRMFEEIFEDFEQNAVMGQLSQITGESPVEGFHQSVSHDKYLEYSDWKKHQIARQNWTQQKALLEQVGESNASLEQSRADSNTRSRLGQDANQPSPTMLPPASQSLIEQSSSEQSSIDFQPFKSLRVTPFNGPGAATKTAPRHSAPEDAVPVMDDSTPISYESGAAKSVLVSPDQQLQVSGPNNATRPTARSADRRNSFGPTKHLRIVGPSSQADIARMKKASSPVERPVKNLMLVGPDNVPTPVTDHLISVPRSNFRSPKSILLGDKQDQQSKVGVKLNRKVVPQTSAPQPQPVSKNDSSDHEISLLERLAEPKTFRPRK